MPAKTVKDLIEFNKTVPRFSQIYVTVEWRGSRYLFVYYSDYGGRAWSETSPERNIYYGTTDVKDYEFLETDTFLRRAKDPENKPLFPWGRVTAISNKNEYLYPCHGAWILDEARAAPGYGPMLYDCALVSLGKKNLGITPGRSLVSMNAAKVWATYYNSRPDVKKRSMNIVGGRHPDDGHGQGEIEDCWSKHERDDEWNSWLNISNSEKRQNYMQAVIKHAYFDNGIKTLDEIRNAGLLIQKDAQTESLSLVNLIYKQTL
jgi:hypothetical protein